MQVIQQELRRLAQDHTKVQEKLREHKAKADAVDELFAYAEHSVQKHEVDPSAIFNDSPTRGLYTPPHVLISADQQRVSTDQH
jgi:hypothetical protein